MSTKSFKSDITKKDLRFYGAILGALLILGYFQRGFDSDTPYVIFAGIGLLIWIYIDNANTYIVINDDRNLTNAGFGGFYKKDTIDIYNIKYVERVPGSVWKSWGSLIVLYIEVDGILQHSKIAEQSYSGETIKEFISELKVINPSIQLNSQYADLINGKIASSEIKSIKAMETVEEVEKRLGISRD